MDSTVVVKVYVSTDTGEGENDGDTMAKSEKYVFRPSRLDFVRQSRITKLHHCTELSLLHIARLIHLFTMMNPRLLPLLLYSSLALIPQTSAFGVVLFEHHFSSEGPVPVQQQTSLRRSCRRPTSALFLSDWSSFQALDDDEDLEIDTTDYAKEEDSQEMKAQVGASLEPPELLEQEVGIEPLFVPSGSQLELDEETVLQVLAACREEIGTLFGYSAENRGVGITGGVDFVEMDGPTVVAVSYTHLTLPTKA